MNAYELADSLEIASSDMEYNYHVNDWKLLYESAIVLRKLQTENEALKEKQNEALSVVKTSWTAISPVNGIPRESAHQLFDVLKDILK